nr:FtsX-like permease family protein [Sphingomicrobium sediminis]
MRAFAASRRATVARLKLVGATKGPLGNMLALEILIVTLAALIPGLALGALAPIIVGAAVGDQLPITPDPGPHLDALGLAAAVGLMVTLAASWRPVVTALRTPPRDMLRASDGASDPERRWSDWLVPILASLGAVILLLVSAGEPMLAAISIAALTVLAIFFAFLGWLVQRLARALRHRGGPVVRLGIAALDRPGNATKRLTVSLGLGLSILVALAAGGQSILAELDGSIPNRAPSHFIVDIPRDEGDALEELVDDFAPGADLRMVSSLRGSIVAVDGIAVEDLPEDRRSWLVRGDRGLTYATDIPQGNRITEGEWWDASYDGVPLVSIEDEAARDLGVGVGDTLTFSIAGREIQAEIASLREVDWQSFGFNFGIVFAPGTLENAPHTLMATVSPGDAGMTDGFERALGERLPMATAISVSDVLAEVRSILTALDAAIRIATLLAIGIGVVVLAGSVVATRAARARDIVLLRLVGGRPRQLVASQLIEFAILSIVAVSLAFGIGLGLAWWALDGNFELPFRPDTPQLVVMAVAAVGVAVLAAMVAVRPALSRTPAEALRIR